MLMRVVRDMHIVSAHPDSASIASGSHFLLRTNVHVVHIMRMTLADYLSTMGETDAVFAARVGLKSHTTINRLKRGLIEASVEVALAIEAETGGAVPADTLCTDVRRVREADGAADPASDAPASMPPSSGAEAALSCGKAGGFAGENLNDGGVACG